MARQCKNGKRKAGKCRQACNQNAASPKRGSADPQVAKIENSIEKGSSMLSCGCLEQPSASKLSPDLRSSNSVINADEQAFFKANGYLLKDKFFSEEDISSMKAEIQRLRPQMINSCVLQDKENNQLHKLSQKSDIFWWLPYNESVQNAVISLLGGPVEVYLDCQSFVKPAWSGHGTAWHQDNAYFQVSDPSNGLGMWVTLDDATEANGTLHVMPWDNTGGMLRHTRDESSNHMLTCREAVESECAASIEVPCILRAGGVVFFRFDVPHCTKENRTDFERSAVAVHFRRLQSDRRFHVERPLNLGLGLTSGNVYSMRDLVARCAGDVDKVCGLIEHILDPKCRFLAHA